MGLLDRFRQESSARLPDPSYDWNRPSSYFPELIGGQMHNKDDLNHLQTTARNDPYAGFAVFKIAKNVFDDWFKFRDPDTGEEIMLDAQEDLKRLNAKQVFYQCLATERWAGWSWLHLNPTKDYEDNIAKGLNVRPIAKLDFFSPIDAKVVEFDEWRNPSVLEFTVPSGPAKRLSANNFILWRTRPYDRTFKGDSVLRGVWDDLVRLREIKNSMAVCASKFGSGVFTFRIGPKAKLTATSKSNIESTYQDISTQTAVILDENLEDIGFVGPPVSATNYETQIKILLEAIAAGWNIPVILLIGAEAGAIQGAEINVKALFQLINSIQGDVEPYVREVVRRLGYSDNYLIEWNVRYAHDEESQARIRITDSQSDVQDLQFMTVNEVRFGRGLPAIEGGDICLSLKDEFQSLKETMQIGQTPEETDQTRNPEGIQI